MAGTARERPCALVLLAAVMTLAAGIAMAQASANAGPGEPSPPVPGENSMELEEVEVIGKKLYQLQRELVEAQDRFYALYNELNTNDDFDIHCLMEARTGALIRKRECRLEFLMEASAKEAQDFYLSITGSAMGSAAISSQMLWLHRQDEYRRNIRAVLEANPQLLELAADWLQRQGQYEKARKERLKGRLILVE
jgi:hypothetical protein